MVTWKAVSKGPENFAGSNLSRLAIKGVKDPFVELINMERNAPVGKRC